MLSKFLAKVKSNSKKIKSKSNAYQKLIPSTLQVNTDGTQKMVQIRTYSDVTPTPTFDQNDYQDNDQYAKQEWSSFEPSHSFPNTDNKDKLDNIESKYDMCDPDVALRLNRLSPSIPTNNNYDDNLLKQKGYNNKKTIVETSVGRTLFSAETVNIFTDASGNKQKKTKKVAIKRVNKQVNSNKTLITADNTHIMCDENIISEAKILKYLTITNRTIRDYIVQYIDFFESSTDYYLIMEYIEGDTKLSQWIAEAHKYIKHNKLELSHYKKIVKYLFWQLAAVMYWMHTCMKICHLDLRIDNIMVENGTFIKNDKTGKYTINSGISLKLLDFGLAERFDNSFICNKYDYTINCALKSPDIFNEREYDARKSDVWSLGVILFQLSFGINPFYYQNIQDPGYYSLRRNKLQIFLKTNKLLKYSNIKMLSILKGMLNLNEDNRMSIIQVIKHVWLKCYFVKYKPCLVYGPKNNNIKKPTKRASIK